MLAMPFISLPVMIQFPAVSGKAISYHVTTTQTFVLPFKGVERVLDDLEHADDCHLDRHPTEGHQGTARHPGNDHSQAGGPAAQLSALRKTEDDAKDQT